MALIVNKFKCKDCGEEFEELYERGEEDTIECCSCGSRNVEKLLSAPKLGKFSMADNDTKASILKKRSHDHTRKEVAKEAERWGAHGKIRQQSQKNVQKGYGD